MDADPPLFRLPLEIQQDIFSYDGLDLRAVRLVSKDIDAAVLDLVVDRYFDPIYCFFPNPERLRHLQSILSTPNLGRHIKQVIFCCDAAEGNQVYDVYTGPTALDPHRTSWMTDWRQVKQETSYGQWVWEQQNTYFEPPDPDLLSPVFRGLRNAGRAKVFVHLDETGATSKLQNNDVAVVSGLLSNPQLPKMYSLYMNLVDWKVEDALRVLKHSRETLTTIVLDIVSIADEGEWRWIKIFEALADCPKLEEMRLENLACEGFGGSALFVGDEPVISVEGREKVKKALRDSIACDIPCYHAPLPDPISAP